MVPHSFVSEHAETLVELDIDYRLLAETSGVPVYVRVPTVATDPLFIDALSDIVAHHVADKVLVSSACGARVCPAEFTRCPMGV